jgi:putative membrane protein
MLAPAWDSKSTLLWLFGAVCRLQPPYHLSCERGGIPFLQQEWSMQRTIASLTVAAVAFWAGSTRAADQPLDNDFVIKASSCEHACVEMAKLGEKHASSPSVKDFASRLTRDHQGCYDKLSEVIKNKKIVVVAGFEKETKAELDRIGKLSGSDFDREFLKWVVAKHREAAGLFEAQAKNGKDADISKFAKDTVPGIRAYLKEAEELSKATN